jgi:hypothetical protein
MQIRWISVLLVVFWIGCGANLASGQVNAYVTIVDTTLASGDTYQMVTVTMQNNVPVQAIELMFTMGRPGVTDFTTDYITIDVDTNAIPPETTIVRNCKIQTAGTLVQDFEWIEAHGEVGDTAFLECDWVKVAGMAYDGSPIPPGSGVLLKLYVDFLCLPDTTQDRTAHIVLTGFISNPVGQVVETEFNFGTLLFDQTYCGNLMDCVCGDVEASGHPSIVDVVYMINWLFSNGSDLCPEIMGDVNAVKGVSIADVVYLVNYLFNDGPDPACVRKY